MRTSRYLLATLKEAPADAEIISHRLMLRAGLIRKLAGGIYTWMPTGLRVLCKVAAIVRDEMNRAGAIEISMPAVQPGELWQESGRWSQYGPELLRLKDRHDRDFVIGPTHEEVVTDIVRREVQSYRQLPLHLYQIQTKFRDEIRPRFGVMRGREFLMKDGYSFHADQADLEREYRVMYETYTRICTRLGLRFRAVAADTGSIGGRRIRAFNRFPRPSGAAAAPSPTRARTRSPIARTRTMRRTSNWPRPLPRSLPDRPPARRWSVCRHRAECAARTSQRSSVCRLRASSRPSPSWAKRASRCCCCAATIN